MPPRLEERDLPPDPVVLFAAWFAGARQAGLALPETMTLATATPDGAPSARVVLLKGVEREGGFLFFTNRDSRKGRELAANPRAALVLHWGPLGRQVRIEGRVEPLADAESDAYFRTRPRGSRIGAWASPQSRPISGRDELERRVAELERTYPGEGIPLPPFWGGYRVRAHAIEFWQHGDDRLHDRFAYRRDAGAWTLTRLAP